MTELRICWRVDLKALFRLHAQLLLQGTAIMYATVGPAAAVEAADGT